MEPYTLFCKCDFSFIMLILNSLLVLDHLNLCVMGGVFAGLVCEQGYLCIW